jgi:hypothetical protein
MMTCEEAIDTIQMRLERTMTLSADDLEFIFGLARERAIQLDSVAAVRPPIFPAEWLDETTDKC